MKGLDKVEKLLFFSFTEMKKVLNSVEGVTSFYVVVQ